MCSYTLTNKVVFTCIHSAGHTASEIDKEGYKPTHVPMKDCTPIHRKVQHMHTYV